MSFPRYPKYKDSGVEWLGEVPEHWRVAPLKHVVRLRSGGTPSKDNQSYWHGEVPWASSKDLKEDSLADTEDHITRQAVEDGAAELIAPGSVLVVVRGMILSHTFPVTKALVPMAINQDLKALTPRGGLHADFLAWLLRGSSGETLNRIDEAGHGTKVLRLDTWTAMQMAIPPASEQINIATFLARETSRIDGLIAEQQQLIDRLHEKRQATISHAVTNGLNRDAPMKSSGIEWLGDVPAHWELTKIKFLTKSMEQGWSPQCEGSPVADDAEWGILKVGCVNEGIFDPSENKALPSHEVPIPSLAIVSDDVLISRANTRQLVGSAAVATRDYLNLMLCDKLYRLRFDPDRTSAAFVTRYLGSTPVRGRIELDATGASASMVNISQSAIMELIIAAPPREEQQEIVGSLEATIGELKALTASAQHAIDLLQERRTALISAAVTGQIDVRGLVPSEAA